LVTLIQPRTGASFRQYEPPPQGSWKGVYGWDGYVVINCATNLPAYPTAVPVGNTSIIWTYSTTEPRALQKPTSPDRFAGAWYTYTNYVLDVNLLDGGAHRIALYCVDWYNLGGVETIQVLDASSRAVIDTRTLTNFYGGTYLIWDIVGHVQFRFTRSPGPFPARLSGIFFDPPRAVAQVELLAPP